MERVLIVEDDPMFQVLLPDLLAWSQAQVRVVGTLHEAVAEMAWEPSLVLTDLGLPDSDGIATVEAILRVADVTPVIVMTGGDNEEVGIEAVRVGAQDYIAKMSLDEEHLRRAVRFAMERRRLELVKREAIRQETENRHLRELAEARGRFYHGIAASMRTALQPLQLHVAMLDGHAISRQGQDAVANVRTQTDALHQVVEEFATIAAIQGGALPLQRRSFQLADAVRARLPAWERHAGDNRVSLDVWLAGVDVHGDPDRLIEVIGRLIDNAVAHTPGGGRVELRVERPGDVVITVMDSGVGVPPERLQGLCTAYLRPANERTGRGLGLAICKGIVEAHGGRLELESDDGFTARIVLPARSF